MTMQQFLEAVGNDMQNELVAVAPVDTGNLRVSVRYEVQGNTINFYMPDYALWLEYGTGMHIEAGHGTPHLIYPKKGKVLHWKSGSKDVFAAYTKGMPAQPFIRNTFYHRFNDILKKNTERYLNGESVSVDFK